MTYYNRLIYDNKEYRKTTSTRQIKVTKSFNGTPVTPEVIEKCFEFSYNMVVNSLNREHRTGGTHNRTQLEIFWDTFRGKIAECVAYEYYESKNCKVSDLDFNYYPRGTWDSFDMSVNGSHISVKSTKHFGQLLLLEVDDWSDTGKYIPNKDKEIEYNYFLLVRTQIENPDNLKEGNLPEKATLRQQCLTLNIQGEVTGTLSRRDFVDKIIKFKYIIQKGQKLGKTTRMDASNYYIHAADLENPDKII